MLDEQFGLWNLANEFDSICTRNKIKYFLIGNQLLYSAKGESHHGYGVDIAMFEVDWNHFCSLEEVENNPNRELEFITDGGMMPGCYFRYVASDTLLLDMDHYSSFIKPGICINVHIFRKNSKISMKLSGLEQGMSDLFLGKHSLRAFWFSMFRSIKGGEKWRKRINEMFRKSAAETSDERVILCEPLKGIHVYENRFWEKSKRIVIRNNSVATNFMTTANVEEYLVKVYGKEWDKIEPYDFRQSYRVITSTSLPYREYLKSISEKNMVTNPFLKDLRAYIVRAESFKYLEKMENDIWKKTMFAAGDRIRLYKKYFPMKEKLLSLAVEEKWGELEILLDDYLLMVDNYLNYDVVMCFDKDIFQLLLQLYRVNGKFEKAEFIESNVKQEDLEPIELGNQEV